MSLSWINRPCQEKISEIRPAFCVENHTARAVAESPAAVFGMGNEYAKSSLPFGKELFGANDVTRTHDLLITNQLLYRLSYISI